MRIKKAPSTIAYKIHDELYTNKILETPSERYIFGERVYFAGCNCFFTALHICKSLKGFCKISL